MSKPDDYIGRHGGSFSYRIGDSRLIVVSASEGHVRVEIEQSDDLYLTTKESLFLAECLINFARRVAPEVVAA